MMTKRTLLMILAVASGLSCAGADTPQADKPVAAPTIETEEQKTFYALGLALANSLGQFNLTESEVELVKAGITDGALNRTPKVDLVQYRPKLNELAQSRAAASAQVEKAKGQEFQTKAAAEPGAVKTPSGLIYVETKAGTGASPKPTDRVKVHYQGTLIDGKVFDSSIQRGQPAEFQLNGVIPCWTEGVQKMKLGGKAKLVCPADIAYGDRGAGADIKPGSTLVFEVELLEINPAGSANPHGN
jgi:FKBP-type peptidyl-prolyl cis-trans isomerase